MAASERDLLSWDGKTFPHCPGRADFETLRFARSWHAEDSADGGFATTDSSDHDTGKDSLGRQVARTGYDGLARRTTLD